MKFSRRGFILPMIYKKTNIFENDDTYISSSAGQVNCQVLYIQQERKNVSFTSPLSIGFLWVCIKFLGLRRTLLSYGTVYYAVQGGSNH